MHCFYIQKFLCHLAVNIRQESGAHFKTAAECEYPQPCWKE